MLEIYTHNEWLRPFNRWPCILIDSGGYIYDAAQYRRELFSHHAIGIMKKCSGDFWEIYDETYFTRLTHFPVGYLKERRDGVKELYDDNPRIHIALSPIGYIKDHRYYTSREFFNIFPRPDYYIKK